MFNSHVDRRDDAERVQEFQQYKYEDKLGMGAYGFVWLASKGKDKYAVKSMKAVADTRSFMREVACLLTLKHHKNIIKILDCFTLGDAGIQNGDCIMLQKIDVELSHFVLIVAPDDRIMNLRLIQSVTYQLLEALAECHKQRILHRDIKPSNVLVDLRKFKLTKIDKLENDACKLADFGLGCLMPTKGRSSRSGADLRMTNEVISMNYRPPELLACTEHRNLYNEAIDIWSVGALMAELFVGRIVFHGRNNSEVLFRIYEYASSIEISSWKQDDVRRLQKSMNKRKNHEYSRPKRDEDKKWYLLKYYPSNAHRVLKTMLMTKHSRTSAADLLRRSFFCEDVFHPRKSKIEIGHVEARKQLERQQYNTVRPYSLDECIRRAKARLAAADLLSG